MSKKSIGTIIMTIAILSTILLPGCATQPQTTQTPSTETTANTYEQISQDEARRLMAEETGYVILDVRTQEEFDERHIEGAICIPNETIGEVEPAELPDKEQLILVYCRSGNRSKQASKKLAKLGYTNVKEFGGINTWYE